MEEKVKYMYGAEIVIGSDGFKGDFVWMYLAEQIAEDVLKAEKEYGEFHFAYEIDRTLDGVKVRISAWEEETVKRVAEALGEEVGIKPHYLKFGMYPPTFEGEK